MQELTFEQVEVVSGGFPGLTGPDDVFRQLDGMMQQMIDGGASSYSAALGAAATLVKWAAGAFAGGYLFESIGGKESVDNAVNNWLDNNAARCTENWESNEHFCNR